jgi:hypothetical protein
MIRHRILFVPLSKYYLSDKIKEAEMVKACTRNEKKRNAQKDLVGNPEGKRLLERPRSRW